VSVVEASGRQGTAAPPRRSRKLARRRRIVPYALLAPAGVYMVLLFLVPLGFLVAMSLSSGSLLSGGFRFSGDFSNYTSALTGYESIYLRSLEWAAIATSLCLLFAYPMTYWIAFYGKRWKSSLLFMILLPFFVSFVIRTVQWKFLLGDTGLIFGPLKAHGLLPESFHVLATPFAIIAGMTYNFLPFTALPLYVALDRIDRRLVEAAKDLYASRWQAFRKVVFPLSLPGVFAAVVLTFIPMTGDYINQQVLGGARGQTMIGSIIQTKFLVESNYPQAAALSVILMLGMLVLASIYARILGTEDASMAAAV
jgi:spermidine/putrescine transport system permease protein